MITPIKTMTINQIVERKDDLLMSDDDIKEMAKNIRAKAIDEFAERLHALEFDNAYGVNVVLTPKQIDEIAEEMRGAE